MTEEQPSFDVEEVIHYWLVEAEEALQVADPWSKRRTIPTPCSLAIWR